MGYFSDYVSARVLHTSIITVSMTERASERVTHTTTSFGVVLQTATANTSTRAIQDSNATSSARAVQTDHSTSSARAAQTAVIESVSAI